MEWDFHEFHRNTHMGREATIYGVRQVAAWDVWLVSPILNPEMGSFAKNIGVTLQVPHGS